MGFLYSITQKLAARMRLSWWNCCKRWDSPDTKPSGESHQPPNPIHNQSRSVLNLRAHQVTDQPFDRLCPNLAQSQIEACLWLVTQQQAEVAEFLQSLVQQ